MILAKLIDRLKYHLFYQFLYPRQFKRYGKNIRWGRDFRYRCIPASIRISCRHLIEIEDNCQIDEGVYLQCHWKGDGIILRAGCRINAHTHLLSYDRIELDQKVLIAPFCLLSSGNHGSPTDHCPIMDLPHLQSGPIFIGYGSWLGHGAKVLGGVQLARQVTVAAGAVVTKSFATPRETLVGIPARSIGVSK